MPVSLAQLGLAIDLRRTFAPQRGNLLSMLRDLPSTAWSAPTACDKWNVASRRLSPRLLIEMIDWAGPEHDRLWFDRAIDAPSLGVSWADIEPAPAWLDSARDVTEFSIHEMQIREAVADQRMAEPSVGIVLDVLARGLPAALGASPTGQTNKMTLHATGAGVS